MPLYSRASGASSYQLNSSILPPSKASSYQHINSTDGLPTGFDVHLYANAFHDWDIDSVKRLSANSFNSLPSGGHIAVFDAHLNESKDGPLSIAEYSCLIMHSTEGRCYSIKEIGGILTSAGFCQIEVTDVAADRTLITGKKM